MTAAQTTDAQTVTVPVLLALEGGATALTIGGIVRRKGRALFVLRADNNNTRARWGTAKEITDDAAYLALTGYLPKPAGPRW